MWCFIRLFCGFLFSTVPQSEILQTKAQALSKTLIKEVIIATKGEQHIKVKPGYVYELSIKDGEVLSTDFNLIARKVDSDLEVLLENDTVVIFDDYFEVRTTDLSYLVSLPSLGGMYHVTDEGTMQLLADGSQIVHVYGDECFLEDIIESQFDSFIQSFKDVYLSDGFYICSIIPPPLGGGKAPTESPVDPPADPNQPASPTDPNQPVAPTDPNQPVDPNDPNQPDDPNDPCNGLIFLDTFQATFFNSAIF